MGKSAKYKCDDAVSCFKNVEYAGYKHWRLPTIDELKTLVYCSKGVKDKDNGRCNYDSESPTISQQAFPNTLSDWYWSGVPVAFAFFGSLNPAPFDFSNGNSNDFNSTM